MIEPHIWKIYLSNWIISPGRGENKKSLKPPPWYSRYWLKQPNCLQTIMSQKSVPIFPRKLWTAQPNTEIISKDWAIFILPLTFTSTNQPFLSLFFLSNLKWLRKICTVMTYKHKTIHGCLEAQQRCELPTQQTLSYPNKIWAIQFDNFSAGCCDVDFFQGLLHYDVFWGNVCFFGRITEHSFRVLFLFAPAQTPQTIPRCVIRRWNNPLFCLFVNWINLRTNTSYENSW